jgi:glycosyltransferase involved in cell wall biosynthesis
VPRWFGPDVAPEYLIHAYIEARGADVVHVAGVFSVPSVQALAAAMAAGRPAVLSPHGSLELAALAFGPVRKKRLWLRAFAPLMRRVTLFHATCTREAESIQRALGPDARVRVVPHGVDLPPLRERPEETGPAIVSFIGRIHRIKALERLIDALAILRDRRVIFRAELAGPSPDEAYAKELGLRVQEHKLDGIVRFVGEVRGDDKVRFYERSRVCVLPSSTENFGNVVVEALSYATPVVASRFTPWAELEEARCGRWTDNSPSALADAIEPYLRSASLSREDGVRGRALVERRYAWPVVATSVIALYKEAIAQGPSVTRGS